YLQPKSVEWLVMEVFLLPGRPWQCVKMPSVESCGSPWTIERRLEEFFGSKL
ncbi:Hypothetical protein FKW44_009325, partial [Caligus rogercresseyi]